ncbi:MULTISPECIES: hypothetical protein [unclassified Haladaptatus]|uniref:DUF7524 family protein n=1 Tax=unclassified Haladaptatus TaxID=2622732 RepID=UPI0023E7AC4F|nr:MULTISPECIES: hypothetical protein [unclassified Haladaptatus]
MSDTLPVHVNRGRLHALETPDSFETGGTFTVNLVNHGEAVHVHLHLDDALSEVAEMEAGNHHVKSDSSRPVRISVREGKRPVRGKLKVVSAYGAETKFVDVKVAEPTVEKQPVEVDESLGKPVPQPDPAPGLMENLSFEGGDIAVLLLGFAALVLALVALVIADSMVFLLGVLTLLAGVLVAVAFLRS